MKHTQNEEAVSPVIGVILMVSITVLLAATIAAFVFGMSGNIPKTKFVGITVQQPMSDIQVVCGTYLAGLMVAISSKFLPLSSY
jgi:flagellin-like protein